MSLLARGKRSGCNLIMKNIRLSFFEIKKFLNKKGFKISKKIDSKQEGTIGNISRTFLVSLTIICFFFISPIIIEFTKKTSFVAVDFENN